MRRASSRCRLGFRLPGGVSTPLSSFSRASRFKVVCDSLTIVHMRDLIMHLLPVWHSRTVVSAIPDVTVGTIHHHRTASPSEYRPSIRTTPQVLDGRTPKNTLGDTAISYLSRQTLRCTTRHDISTKLLESEQTPASNHPPIRTGNTK